MSRPRSPSIGTVIRKHPATSLLQQSLGCDVLVAEALVLRLASWLRDRGGPRFYAKEHLAVVLGLPSWDPGTLRALLLGSGWVVQRDLRYGGVGYEMAHWGQLFPEDARRERDKKRKRVARLQGKIQTVFTMPMPPAFAD